MPLDLFSGLNAIEERAQSNSKLLEFEWFSVPVGKLAVKGTDKLSSKLYITPPLLVTPERIVLVQEERSAILKIQQIEAGTGKYKETTVVKVDTAELEASGIALETLDKTQIAVPKVWGALPGPLLSEGYADRLDEARMKVQALLFENKDKLDPKMLQVAEDLVGTDGKVTISQILSGDTLDQLEQMTSIQAMERKQKPLFRQILEAHFEMPANHMRLVPTGVLTQVYARLNQILQEETEGLEIVNDLSGSKETPKKLSSPSSKKSRSTKTA